MLRRRNSAAQWLLFMVRRKRTHISASNIKRFSLIQSFLCSLVCSALMALPASGQTPTEAWHVPELDTGFHLLYELKPAEARAQFESWQKSHPEDPLGSASEAAAYLFEECYRQGVLTSDFFLDDKRFLGKVALSQRPRNCAPPSSLRTNRRRPWRNCD